MFTSNKWLKLKTPPNSIGRKDFIKNLVKEFHSTTNIEAHEQITANLANFAYDPINFQYLYEANALDLFILLLSSPDEKLVLHGAAGLCNICIDPRCREEITKPENLKIIFELFQNTSAIETTIHLLTLIYILASFKDLRSNICTSENIQRIDNLRKSSDNRIRSLVIVLLEDFVTNDQKNL